jgi:hypothetical protein
MFALFEECYDMFLVLIWDKEKIKLFVLNNELVKSKRINYVTPEGWVLELLILGLSLFLILKNSASWHPGVRE